MSDDDPIRESVFHRVRKALPAAGSRLAAVSVVVVTLLTATSVGALVMYRQGHRLAASAARVVTPSPLAFPTESPVVLPGQAQVSAPSHNVVWVLVNYDHLYLSIDGGTNWQRRLLPADPGVRPTVSFIDDHEGWLLAPGSPTTECQQASSAIWHTTDGGATWHRLPVRGIATAQCKELIYFADSRHGFVSAWDDSGKPTVYATADGGAAWRGVSLPEGPLFVTKPGGFTLRVDWIKQFGSTAYLEATGQQSDSMWPLRSFIYTSNDAGATWAWKQKLPSAETVMVTASRWLQYGPDFLESRDGGHGFSPYNTDYFPLSPALGGTVMVFADASVGYATGRGQLEVTTDGGAHWAMIPTPGAGVPPSPSPSPIPMPADVQVSATPNTIWALVNSSSLFRSTDKGKTWLRKAFPPGGFPGEAAAISFVDDFHGYALLPGEPGTQCLQAGASLYATSDSANTWDLVAIVKSENRAPQGLPFSQCKDFVYFLDPYFGIVAGHDTTNPPVISVTQNGGRTWSQATLPNQPGFGSGGPALRVTQIKNFGSRMLLEASGPGATGQQRSFIYQSTDGGASWSLLEPATGDEVFATSMRWLRLAGAVREETADGGVSWHAFVTDYSNPGGVESTFSFVDAFLGYGVAGGQIERTTDGGVHWELIKSTWP